MIAPTGQGSDRGGAPIPAPRVFAFRRDRAGSAASVGGRVVLELPGDGFVLGEHATPSSTLLVVAETREGESDRLHVLAPGARVRAELLPPAAAEARARRNGGVLHV